MLLTLACGGPELPLEATVATLTPVRGAVTVGDHEAPFARRVAEDEVVTVAPDGLARLTMDDGGRALLADATLRAVDGATLSLEDGRAYLEAEGDALEIRTDRATLRLRDAGVSVAVEEGVLRAYVVRGELSWTRGGERGITGAGRELLVDERGARVEPATLWDDWTRGLAEPGPAETLAVEGVGMLTARVPDEVGQARWPLVIRRLDVRVRVEGDLARTEVDQVFFNPASETLEGLYRVRVPRAAVLSRFAVDREGVLVDGYVRERGQALTAYTEQVYRGSTDDPALLEWDGPQAYSARIYPIRPGETRRIVVSYGQWLPRHGDAQTYRYPMGGAGDAARIQELSIAVDLSGVELEAVRAGLGARVEGRVVRLRRSDFLPRADFWLDLVGGPDPRPAQRAWRAPHEPPERASAMRPGTREADERDYFYLPLVLPDDVGGALADGLDVVVIADVSAATDRAHLELGRTAVESLVGRLGPDDRVAVVGADLGLRPVEGDDGVLGPATPDRVERLLEGIARLGAGGATDLGATLAEAAERLDPERQGIVVYVGDGRPTVGERTAGALRERLARLPRRPRLYAVAIGEDAQADLLEAVTAGGGLTARVEERRAAAEAALDIVAHARRPIARDVVIDVGDGIANAYPREPVDVVVGDVLSVVGRVAGEPPARVAVSGTIDGAPFTRDIPLVLAPTAAATDLRLRWAGARLTRILAEGATREEVAELGVRYGAITPYTSYYVPSAREMAQAAAQTAPTTTTPAVDEPMAAEEAEAPMDWAEPSAPSPPPAVMPRPDDPFPPPRRMRAGGGSGGSAPRPIERAIGGRWSAGTPSVSGAEAGAIARVVRGRAASYRRCYEVGLRSQPGLAGTITVQFTIADGSVTQASASGGLNGQVIGCVLAVIRGLRFEGVASATVTYPFTFTSDGGGPAFSLIALQTLPLAIEALGERAREGQHVGRRCSDASRVPLEERQALWRERLDRDGWLAVHVAAIRDCEARTWRERRALLSVILGHAGGVPGMLAVYSLLESAAARGHA
ncbi:MAG: VIT domain-containing protein, partial [Sandaracinaceae bacterium]